MTTIGPLPSTLSGAPTPASNARKSLRADNQNGGASSFADLLSDKSGADPSKSKDADVDAVAPGGSKLPFPPAEGDDAEGTKNLDPNARPPGPPMLPPISALTAQQAAMTALPTQTSNQASESKQQDSADVVATDPVSMAPAMTSSDPRVKMPLIRPHGPPPTDGPAGPSDSIAPVADPAATTAQNAKANPPAIEPHGPPDTLPSLKQSAPLQTKTAAMETVDAAENADAIQPRLVPLNPPDQLDASAATITSAADVATKKAIISPIEPHGPPNLSDSTAKAVAIPATNPIKHPPLPAIEPHGPPEMPDDTVSAPVLTAGTANKLEYTTTIPSPGDLTISPVQTNLTPVAGMAKGEYTTTIPAPADDAQAAIREQKKAAEAADVHPSGGGGGSFWDGGLGAPKPIYPPETPLEITSAFQARVPSGTLATDAASTAAESAKQVVTNGSDPTDKSAPNAAIRPANLAAPSMTNARRFLGTTDNLSPQHTTEEIVINNRLPSGTPVAKEQAIVTADVSNPETSADRSGLPGRAMVASPATAVNAGAGKAAFVLPASAVSTVTADTTATATAATNATRSIPTSEHIQKMLQTVLDAGIKTAVNDNNQLEMRVRLDGGANDVTVRLRMQDSAMHVTFQTSSPELRQALERGWSDFSATAAQSASVTLEPPRFVADQPARSQDAANFFGGQQNSSRQDAPRAAEDAAPMAGSAWRGSRIVSSTITQPTPTASAANPRWTGWA